MTYPPFSYKSPIPTKNKHSPPENGWLEDYFPFEMVTLQGRTVGFREVVPTKNFKIQEKRGTSVANMAVSQSNTLVAPIPLIAMTDSIPLQKGSTWAPTSYIINGAITPISR